MICPVKCEFGLLSLLYACLPANFMLVENRPGISMCVYVSLKCFASPPTHGLTLPLPLLFCLIQLFTHGRNIDSLMRTHLVILWWNHVIAFFIFLRYCKITVAQNVVPMWVFVRIIETTCIFMTCLDHYYVCCKMDLWRIKWASIFFRNPFFQHGELLFASNKTMIGRDWPSRNSVLLARSIEKVSISGHCLTNLCSLWNSNMREQSLPSHELIFCFVKYNKLETIPFHLSFVPGPG